MTDRLQQLEAVAKAAFDYRHLITTETHRALVRAVDALAAHDAQPAVVGETVEVRGCVGVDEHGRVYGYCMSDESDEELRGGVESSDYEPVGMFSLHVPKVRPTLPEILASVEPKI